ncbi:MAG: undecaprenyl/decaprenyl-phosphate alpha-N-acetylglucosaminyl 1-phosphate transferase [Deltaproteobacteria bacterium]|nr:undecaprenyl/decaprenyl-phosphate alpha-N-acetylglucosaminyl 1-phosphate transferase [Deltaproteobacteria bacterium]MBW1964894.1 undecaprenyl/decaprenyl-phosphate alpha-N-acetylglucosaminyl 1-phosphate transferase [Deltaproteobacteria bacterium]
MSLVITTLFFSIFITISLIPLFSKLSIWLHAMDIPDRRKVHKRPMPRLGGVAMALGILTTALIFLPKNGFVNAFLIGSGVIVLFGLMDDLIELGYKSKFAGQIIGTLIVIFYGKVRIVTLGTLIPSSLCLSDWSSFLLTVLVIVGVTNAINLSDGLDGLAGGICLLTFSCIGYLAYKEGMFAILLLAISMAGVIFGFLRFNTYPATIFMGDTGSQLLGFSGIVLAIKLTQESFSLSPVLPLILFGFPILDTLSVMSQRIVEGRSPFVADKNHIHHKFIRLGCFHTEAVFFIYIMHSLFVTSAFLFRSSSDRLLLIGYTIFSAIILVVFLFAERSGLKIKRYYLIDKVLKGRLKVLKERGILVRSCFLPVKLGLPALVFFTAFVPSTIPRYFSFLAVLFVILIASSYIFKKAWLGDTVEITIYLIIPILVYLSEKNAVTWMTHQYTLTYDLSFLVLAFFVILTLKFTRRQKGFKVSPMDFLILFIVLIVPILPDQRIQNYNLGMLASKIIVLFFSYEVLLGELRGKLEGLSLTVLATFSVIALRGLIM